MSNFNLPIVITGCQRSGTTLLLLVFNAHPSVHGIDETLFDPKQLPFYLKAPRYAPAVCFKVPLIAHEVAYIASFPGVKVLWSLRDPRDVVASMVRLQFEHKGIKASFAAHPHVGPRVQIPLLLRALEEVPVGLREEVQLFQEQDVIPPEDRSLDLNVTAAALCWRLKQELLRLYRQEEIDLRIIRYEQLVADPTPVVAEILSFVGLPWHDQVLAHHRFHRGKVTGDTDSTRPIDQKSMGRWRQMFSTSQLEIIERICAEKANELGYPL